MEKNLTTKVILPKKVKNFTDYFEINESDFNTTGAFNRFIGIDAKFFVDPQLLDKSSAIEFKDSRRLVVNHYQNIMRLLNSGNALGIKSAKKLLKFPEVIGIGMGYSNYSDDGNSIGKKLSKNLLETCQEILNMGIKDSEIFELVGLFQEDFGADRISDMTIFIIQEKIYEYTDRISKELKIKNCKNFISPKTQKRYLIPYNKETQKPLFLLPKDILRDLPMANSLDEIEKLVRENDLARETINKILGEEWKKQDLKKSDIQEVLLKHIDILKQLLKDYKNLPHIHYDFEKDPSGEVSWYKQGIQMANDNPIFLKSLSKEPTREELLETVEKIIIHYKKLIEYNGLNKLLFRKNKDGHMIARHEKYSQLLFFMCASIYCVANGLDLSPECNKGRGPVDFKISYGELRKIVVEIKLSKNSNLINGITKQLPEYQKAEGAFEAFYIIVKVTKDAPKINEIMEIEIEEKSKGKYFPKWYVVDANIKPSASKLK